MDDVFFIDRDGNKIYSDTIASHIGLANLILEQNNQWDEEYKKSGMNDPVDFLVLRKGYLKLSNLGPYYRRIVYSSARLTEKQRDLIEYYHEEGYDIDDLDDLELRRLMEEESR